MAACGVGALGAGLDKDLAGVTAGHAAASAAAPRAVEEGVVDGGEAEQGAMPGVPAGDVDDDAELAEQIAMWEQAAGEDYAGVGFDDIDHEEMERIKHEAERFEPGSASLPGHNLFEHDVPLAPGEVPQPPAQPFHPPSVTAMSSRSKHPGGGITDAEYREWKSQAMSDYPQPDDEDVARPPQQPQTPMFRTKM